MNGNLLLYMLVFAGIVLLVVYIKTRRPVSSVVLTALQGVGAFFAVNLVGTLLGVHLNLNPFSALVSVLGGAPGVIFLLVMNTL